jgi:predicted ATPase
MAITRIRIDGYRSVRSITFPVEPLTVFVGRNGVGKTNLYRSLQLLQAAAAGTFSRELAAEGGLGSAIWAGERKKHEQPRIALAVDLRDGETGVAYGYEIACGFPNKISVAAFGLEPQVKEERLTLKPGRRPVALLERTGPAVALRDDAGRRETVDHEMLASETAFARIGDAGSAPEIDRIRRLVLDWRFYHALRTDADSPLRRPCLAVTTPTLASDGSDLAAVFATLAHIRGDTADLDETVGDAFPGAELVVPPPEQAAEFGLRMPDYPKRVFTAAELSDGTLRFLALAGALLGYRLPSFVALNEPESSLHPELLPALGRLIARAAARTQIWVVTHSEPLAVAIADHAAVVPLEVVKREGATWIEGLAAGGWFRDQ